MNGPVYISPQCYLALNGDNSNVLIAEVSASFVEVVVEIDKTGLVSRDRTILWRVHMVLIFTCSCVCDDLVIVKVY